MAEEEIARINSERLKVMSQLYSNNKEMERVKAEAKRIKAEAKRIISLESKEEMKHLEEAFERLNAESESESEAEAESESESESESDSDFEFEFESESESESESLEPLKEAMKRLNAESECLKQESDRLTSIYEHIQSVMSSLRKPSKKINPTYPRISGASRAAFKRTANDIRARNGGTTSMIATYMLADTIADLTLQEDDDDNNSD